MPYKQLTDEQLATAKEMLDGGASVADTAKATGISAPTLYKRFKTKTDPRPGGRAKKTTTKVAPTDAQLTSVFSKVAVAPAIPMGLWVKCDFCAGHFVRTGPDAAAKLVELSKDHPALRNVMETVWRLGDEIAWAGVLTMWLGVPIAHHMAPDFIYKWLQYPLGMPARGVPSAAQNGHTHAQTGPEPASPFGDMDIESLMRMAQSMGVQFDQGVPFETPTVNGDDADATAEAAAAPDEAAADSSATVATDAGDTNTG